MNADEIPKGIDGWNWGAFLLTPFWSLSNQAWLGLICWLPHLILNLTLAILMSSQKNLLGTALNILGLWKFLFFVVYFGVAIFLGTYGNHISWEKTNWSNVQEFRAYQRHWAIAGICFGIPYSLLNFYLWERFTDFAYYIVNQ
ncbi:hypothetical protein TUMEXPCC7403_25055 [Tumidithrix helvetica PCC 7403]|uniref:hypothetical protein n=1 Tax=Tumidithrix helvetica TaxID=3457545 RepID=UPI003C9394B8